MHNLKEINFSFSEIQLIKISFPSLFHIDFFIQCAFKVVSQTLCCTCEVFPSQVSFCRSFDKALKLPFQKRKQIGHLFSVFPPLCILILGVSSSSGQSILPTSLTWDKLLFALGNRMLAYMTQRLCISALWCPSARTMRKDVPRQCTGSKKMRDT